MAAIKPEIAERIKKRLLFIYGTAPEMDIFARIAGLVEKYAASPVPPATRTGWDQTDAMLFTYANTITEGNHPPLAVLARFLDQYVGDRVSLLHLLPFYPSTSDDGFAVADFRQVDPALGTWDHITHLARSYRLMFDGVLNHVSATSAYFKDYAGGNPAFRDFFISLPPDADTSSVVRPRNLPLLHDFPTVRGTERLWTTFSRDQIDLNYGNPAVLLEILDVLLFYAARGASLIRLDAIPYLWKEPGTPCIHLPRTHEIVKLFRDVFDAVFPQVLILAESNVPHQENIAYFGDHGDEAQLVYNFPLAPLIAYGVIRGDARPLTAWAQGIGQISDRTTYLNVTATHDGIGLRPTEYLLEEPQRQTLIDRCLAHGGRISGRTRFDGSVIPYEMNITYYDLLNHPESTEPLQLQVSRFLLSQAIPLSFIGIPGIYIQPFLGSRNYTQGVARTGQARSINRRQFSLPRLDAELADRHSRRYRVLARYLKLLEARKKVPAFHPNAWQQVVEAEPAFFIVRRVNAAAGQTVTALHNLTDTTCTCHCPVLKRGQPNRDLLSGEVVTGDLVPMGPYQFRWLENMVQSGSSRQKP